MLQQAAATLYYTPGPYFMRAAGLAATQIGYHKRFLIMRNLSDIDKAQSTRGSISQIPPQFIASNPILAKLNEDAKQKRILLSGSAPESVKSMIEDSEEEFFIYMLNPKIIDTSPRARLRQEGCLSEGR